jgi:hypothetical protein
VAFLGWLRLDAAGEKKPIEALVFSDEVGGGVGSFRRAWVTAVLKANDVDVKWCADRGYRHLTPECEEAFGKLPLHWHDLRHEYASRLVQRGVPLAQVRDLLGHASITTTERYDNQKLENLQASATKLEEGKILAPSPSTTTQPAPPRRDPWDARLGTADAAPLRGCASGIFFRVFSLTAPTIVCSRSLSKGAPALGMPSSSCRPP